MDVQAEKLKWLNRTELEMLSDKSLSLHEREKISESLRTINSTWNKVYIKNQCDDFPWLLILFSKGWDHVNFGFIYTQIWTHFTNAD